MTLARLVRSPLSLAAVLSLVVASALLFPWATAPALAHHGGEHGPPVEAQAPPPPEQPRAEAGPNQTVDESDVRYLTNKVILDADASHCGSKDHSDRTKCTGELSYRWYGGTSTNTYGIMKSLKLEKQDGLSPSQIEATVPWVPHDMTFSVTVIVTHENGRTSDDTVYVTVRNTQEPELITSNRDEQRVLYATFWDYHEDWWWSIKGRDKCYTPRRDKSGYHEFVIDDDLKPQTWYTIIVYSNTCQDDSEITRYLAITSVGNRDPKARASTRNNYIGDGARTRLNCRKSSDPDGDPLTCHWTAPEGWEPRTSTKKQPWFTSTDDVPRIRDKHYEFTLRVTDPDGAWDEDHLKVVVFDDPPEPRVTDVYQTDATAWIGNHNGSRRWSLEWSSPTTDESGCVDKRNRNHRMKGLKPDEPYTVSIHRDYGCQSGKRLEYVTFRTRE